MVQLVLPTHCPECNRPVEQDAFQCPDCELILEGVVLDNFPLHTGFTVVRALLEPPTASMSRASIVVPPEVKAAAQHRTRRNVTAPTVVMFFPAGLDDIPHVLADLDLTQLRLSSFEAFILSMMDGKMSVNDLRLSAGLEKAEVQAVMKSLLDKKVVRISEAVARPARPPRPVSAEDLGLSLEPVEEDLPPPPPTPPPVVRPALAPMAATSPRKPAFVPPPPTPAPVLVEAAPPGAPASPAMQAFLDGLKSPKPKSVADDATGPDAANLQRAIALEKAGNIDGAVEVLERAIARSKKPAALYNRLGIVLLKERRDLGRAETYLAKARKLEPDNSVYEQNYFRVVAMNAAVTGVRENPLLGRR